MRFIYIKIGLLIIAWITLTLVNFYFVPYFLLAFELLLVILISIILAVLWVIKAGRTETKVPKQTTIFYIVTTILIILTIYPHPINKIIEKADWYIFYSKRNEIVQMVKNKELNPNVSWNNVLCELPFEFPVISNGGNDILIERVNNTNNVTVTFWIFRNFFSAPSTRLVFTNDITEIRRINNLIEKDPANNWVIEENWYRTFGE